MFVIIRQNLCKLLTVKINGDTISLHVNMFIVLVALGDVREQYIEEELV